MTAHRGRNREFRAAGIARVLRARGIARMLGPAVATLAGVPVLALVPPLIVAGGCGKDAISVSARGNGADYGRGAVIEAVAGFGASDKSVQDYRAMAVAIEKLRPKFNDDVELLAERNLVFLALGPLDAVFGQPFDAQRDALGVTVWPSALGIEPKPDEDAAAYTERICGDGLSLECKYAVPHYRSLVLSALVWNRFLARARDALTRCDECADNPGFAESVKRYAARERAMSAKLGDAESRVHPKHWPIAGEHASTWPPAPDSAGDAVLAVPLLLVSSAGAARIGDTEIAAGEWRQALADARGDATALAVSIPASAKVEELRAIARDAQAAGYSELVLLAHAPEFPFARRAYRIALTAAGATRVRVRDVDTIQVLVQGLDALIAGGATALNIR